VNAAKRAVRALAAHTNSMVTHLVTFYQLLVVCSGHW
jgi:hypothetical protein